MVQVQMQAAAEDKAATVAQAAAKDKADAMAQAVTNATAAARETP